MERRLSQNFRIMIRSAMVTLFILSCAAAAFYFCGHAYSVMEATATGKSAEAFIIPEKDVFLVFGKEIRLPLMTVAEKITWTAKKYSPGMIKLLGYAVDGTEKLIYTLLNCIVP